MQEEVNKFMLLEMKQELSWRNHSVMKMNVISNEQMIGCFEAPYISRTERRADGLFQFRGTYRSNHSYDINFNPMACPAGYTDGMFSYSKKDSSTNSKYTMMKMSYDITKDGQMFTQVLTMQETLPKKGFFSKNKTLDYYSFQLATDTYQCYHIAKNGLGIWYCIYKNGALIAEIKKSMQVTDYLHNYKLYFIDGVDIDLMCLLTGILHAKYYEAFKPDNAESLNSQNIMNERNCISNELRQEMLDKFDPKFVEQME